MEDYLVQSGVFSHKSVRYPAVLGFPAGLEVTPKSFFILLVYNEMDMRGKQHRASGASSTSVCLNKKMKRVMQASTCSCSQWFLEISWRCFLVKEYLWNWSMKFLQTNLSGAWEKKMLKTVFHDVCRLSTTIFRAVRKIVLMLLFSKPDLC